MPRNDLGGRRQRYARWVRAAAVYPPLLRYLARGPLLAEALDQASPAPTWGPAPDGRPLDLAPRQAPGPIGARPRFVPPRVLSGLSRLQSTTETAAPLWPEHASAPADEARISARQSPPTGSAPSASTGDEPPAGDEAPRA